MFAKRLKEAGFTTKQAEVLAEEQAELIEQEIATKRDLKEMELKITAKIISWVAGMMVAQTGIIVALVKIIN